MSTRASADPNVLAQSILAEFVKANPACCECKAPRTLPMVMIVAVTKDDSVYINIHLGITLCRDCANVLSYLEGDFAHNIAFPVLARYKLPLHVAYVL